MTTKKKTKLDFETNMTDRQVLRVLREFHRVSAAMRDVGMDATLDGVLTEATMLSEFRNLLIVAVEYATAFKDGEAIDKLLNETKAIDDKALAKMKEKQQAKIVSESPFVSFIESMRQQQQQVCKECGQHICGGCGKCHECEARKKAPLN